MSGIRSVCFFIAMVVLLYLNHTVCAQTSRYVALGGRDLGDCTDVAEPCSSIGYALEQALPKDVVHISVGIFSSPEELLLDKEITIKGEGALNTAIQANAKINTASHRVFHIPPGITATLESVTVQHGVSPGDESESEDGGGILNEGTLTLNRCTVLRNGTRSAELSGHGGGIFNSGFLALNECSMDDNFTGAGDTDDTSFDGTSGSGGGVYNQGTLIINDSKIIKNGTGFGRGEAGDGGGIFNSHNAVLTVHASTFRENSGGGVVEDAGDDGGSGAGIFNAGSMVLEGCSITANKTGSGFFNGADGGGVFNGSEASATLLACTISGNLTGEGFGDGFGSFGTGGGGAGIFNLGVLNLTHSTVTGNRTGDAQLIECFCEDDGSDDLDCQFACEENFDDEDDEFTVTRTGGSGGGGAGIFNAAQSMTIIESSTICANTTGQAFAGGFGGGVYSADTGIVELYNTILANNSAPNGRGPDCFGTLTSRSYNLISDPTDCILEGDLTGNLLNRDPRLTSLQDHGGSTFTHALLANSPALDAGDPSFSSPPDRDQRGAPRIHGKRVDIGSVEARGEFFSAYNDLSWALGQREQNITRYTTHAGVGVSPEGDGGALRDFQTGAPLLVTLTVTGGNWNGSTHVKQGSGGAEGTDAHALFDGIVDATGVISYGASNNDSTAEPITLTFSGLDPEGYYELVVFGNRNKVKYADRFSKTTLVGADGFLNVSSKGSSKSGLRDENTIIQSGSNTERGLVAWYQFVQPGKDGIVQIIQSDGGSLSSSRPYLNAVKIAKVPPPTSRTFLFAGFGFMSIGGGLAGIDESFELVGPLDVTFGAKAETAYVDASNVTLKAFSDEGKTSSFEGARLDDLWNLSSVRGTPLVRTPNFETFEFVGQDFQGADFIVRISIELDRFSLLRKRELLMSGKNSPECCDFFSLNMESEFPSSAGEVNTGPFTAYNDLSWGVGQQTINITRYTKQASSGRWVLPFLRLFRTPTRRR